MDECPICLDPLDTMVNYCLTPCKHAFHTTCLRSIKFERCPMCNYELKNPRKIKDTITLFDKVKRFLHMVKLFIIKCLC